MGSKKTLRIPRNILSEMTNGNPQAIKAMEGLQIGVFDLLPTDIADIIQRAAADAMQAAMIANQVRQELSPYLQAVSVPIEQSSYLQSVGSSCDCIQQLQAI